MNHLRISVVHLSSHGVLRKLGAIPWGEVISGSLAAKVINSNNKMVLWGFILITLTFN